MVGLMRSRTATATEWDDPSLVRTKTEVATLPQMQPVIRRATGFVLSSLGAGMIVIAFFWWLRS